MDVLGANYRRSASSLFTVIHGKLVTASDFKMGRAEDNWTEKTCIKRLAPSL